MANNLYNQLLKCRRLSEISNPERIADYNRLLCKTEALISFFGSMSEVSNDVALDINHIVRKIGAELEDRVYEGRKSYNIY